MTKITTVPENYNSIRADIIELLNAARSAASRNVNALMTTTYWGNWKKDRPVRASRGEESRVWRCPHKAPGKRSLGFIWQEDLDRVTSAQMRSFYLVWPQDKILQTLSAKYPTTIHLNEIHGNAQLVQDLATQFPLPWSAYVRLLSVKNLEARNFYESEARRSGWSIRQLDRQIGSQFYERTALSQNKGAMLEKAENSEPGDLAPEETIKDPFVLRRVTIPQIEAAADE
jgi:hypothetical protein